MSRSIHGIGNDTKAGALPSKPDFSSAAMKKSLQFIQSMKENVNENSVTIGWSGFDDEIVGAIVSRRNKFVILGFWCETHSSIYSSCIEKGSKTT